MEEENKEAPEVDQGTLYTLIRTGIMIDQGECHIWINACRADPQWRSVLKELDQGRHVDDFVLTTVRVMEVKKHGHEEVEVPTSLHQLVKRDCHDVPSWATWPWAGRWT